MTSDAALNYNINTDLPDLGLPDGAKSKSEGIGILVDMAKAGKIDPWNIDIVDVTDKYLAHICEMKSQNLRLTGRTFLFAAVLLKLKSNVLEGIDVMQFEPYDPADDIQYDDDGFIVDYGEDNYVPTNNVISIDEVLQRRTSVRLNHNRVVTLKDLIRQLEFYEKLEKKQSLKEAHERAKRRVQSYSRLTADDIVNLAHEEYIETCVLKLKENLAQIFTKNVRDKMLPFKESVMAHDWLAAFIANEQKGIAYIEKPLFDYRLHTNNVFGGRNLSQNLARWKEKNGKTFKSYLKYRKEDVIDKAYLSGAKMCLDYTKKQSTIKFLNEIINYYTSIEKSKYINFQIYKYFKYLYGNNMIKKMCKEILIFHFPILGYLKFKIG